MKFKLSTLIWLTTLLAIFIAGWALVRSEREKRLEAEVNAELRTDEITKQFLLADTQLRKMQQQFERLEERAKVFKGLNAKSPPHLAWLGQASWVNGSSTDRLPTVWDWRIFLPVDHPRLEFRWAVEQIPKSGFPPDAVVNRREIFVGRKSGSPSEGFKLSQWLGCAVLHCELKANRKSNLQCRLNQSPHGLTAGPYETDAFYGSEQPITTECDWLHAAILGNQSSTESVEVDEGDSRAVSFDKPHVLVRIRGKRKSGDRLTEVEGPAPGFMLWLQKKE